MRPLSAGPTVRRSWFQPIRPRRYIWRPGVVARNPTQVSRSLFQRTPICRRVRAAARPPSRCTFFTDSLPAVLVPPVVFTGLLLALWSYKCMMTVIFQDKIIYMPYMPPFTRSEKMRDYTASCAPVQWKEEFIRSLDGTKLALCIGHIQPHPEGDDGPVYTQGTKSVILVHFHGNGGSLPPRLPMLSNVLKAVVARSSDDPPTRYTLIALSYRGFWSSSGRASQTGIEMDAQALLRWIKVAYCSKNTDTELVLWGQSIGAGVASTTAAKYLSGSSPDDPGITGLVMETPFTGIKAMLLALYPQKWLPYKYLWPFLWNHWDSVAALRQLALNDHPPRILLLPATRDEVVPRDEVKKLQQLCEDLELDVQRRDVIGSLHTEATTRREGQEALARFVVELTEPRRKHNHLQSEQA